MDKSHKDKAAGTAQKTATKKKMAQATFTNTATHSGFTQSTITALDAWNGYQESLKLKVMQEAPQELLNELKTIALHYGVLKSSHHTLLEEYSVLRKTFIELLEAYKREKRLKGLDLDQHFDEVWLDKAWLI